jgi:hypothetical protein
LLSNIARATSTPPPTRFSCCDEEGPVALFVFGPSFRLYDDIRAAMALDQKAGELLQQLGRGALEGPWSVAEGLLLHGKRVFVPSHGDLRHQVVALAHTAGHEGIQKTLVRLRQDFYLPGDRTLV